MATKRQRMALAPVTTGEPKLSLPQFVASLPPGSDARVLACTASVAECYLAYCYLCRTGLWDDLTLRLSACGTLYFVCTPGAVKPQPEVEAEERQPFRRSTRPRRDRGHSPVAAAAAAGDAGEGRVTSSHAPRDGPFQPAPASRSNSSGGVSGGDVDEAEEPPRGWCPDDAGASDRGDEDHPAVAAVADAAAAAAAAAPPAPGGDVVAAQRVTTITVPVSIGTCAPSPERLHQLLSLSDTEDGAPVSLALVDGDGTVIVSNIYRGMVPPPALDAAAGDEDEEELGEVEEEAPPAAAAAAAADEDEDGDDGVGDGHPPQSGPDTHDQHATDATLAAGPQPEEGRDAMAAAQPGAGDDKVGAGADALS